MPTIPPGEQTEIRSGPIGRSLALYVFQPQTIWNADITGGPYEVGALVLETTNPSGNPGLVGVDQTIWVTTSGGVSLGRVRCRSLDGTTLTVAENAIPWEDGVKVYVKLLYEIWPKWPYFDADTETIYKDRDITWVSDARTQSPKANAGPMAIGRFNGGGYAELTFTGGRSFKVPSGAAVDGYNWEVFGTASYTVVGGGLTQETVTIRFSEAGYFYVVLTVADGAETGVVRVPVVIDDGTAPFTRLQYDPRRWAEYGWELDFSLMGVYGLLYDGLIYEGALVGLAALDDRQTAPSAFYTDRANVRWQGWLISDDVERDALTRLGGFAAISSAHMLARLRAFPTRVEDSGSPTNWHTLTNVCLDSAVYHVGLWHSTLMSTCHWEPTGEWQNRPIQAQSFEAGNLLEQFNEVLKAAKGAMRCDRQGIVRAWRNPWFMSSIEQAALDTVLTLQASDWERITVSGRDYRPKQSEIVMGGYADTTPLLAGSPGQSPLEGGGATEEQGLAPVDQTELTRWAGQGLAVANRQIEAQLDMTGEFDVFDPAIAELVAGDLPSYDSRMPDGPYVVAGAEIDFNPQTGVSRNRITLLPDPGQYPGEAREIPPIPDPPPSDPIDWWPAPIEPPIPIGWPSQLYVGTRVSGVYFTNDFDGPGTAQPTWTAVNGGLASTVIHHMGINPFDRANGQFCMTGDYYVTPEDVVLYRRLNQGSWVEVLDQAAYAAITGLPGSVLAWFCLDHSVEGRLWVVGHVHDADGGTWALYSDNLGTTWSSPIQVRSGWTRLVHGIAAHGDEVYVGITTGPIAGQRIYYSADKGSSPFLYSDSLQISVWECFIYYNRLELSQIYTRRYETLGQPPYDLVRITCPSMTDTDLQASLDLMTFYYPDSLWFSRSSPGYHRCLKTATGDPAQIIVTEDSWASVNNSNPSPLSVQADAMAPYVNPEDEDMILLGHRRNVGDGGGDYKHHLSALYGETSTSPEGRAGSMPHTSPYTDSIPCTAGGIAYHGIQVVA